MADVTKYLRLLCALINQKETRDFDFGRAARDMEMNLSGVETQWRRLRTALREEGLPAAPRVSRVPRAPRQQPARPAVARASVREVQKDPTEEIDANGVVGFQNEESGQTMAGSNKEGGHNKRATKCADEKDEKDDQKGMGRDEGISGTAGEHGEVDESSFYYEEEYPDEI